MSNEYHKSLYRSFPSQPFEDTVRVAFDGCYYHFERLQEYMNRPGMQLAWDQLGVTDLQKRQSLQDDINKFSWHLRGFFWEQIATFDTLLQWANDAYTLGLKEKDVDWDGVKKRAARNQTSEWKKIYQLLESARDSEWFFEVNAYRNFAHRNYLSNVSVHNEEGLMQLSLLQVREGQEAFMPIESQLSNYGVKMAELVNATLPAVKS